MIDIFHISRICGKGTNYLRYYRKCDAVFISHGLFLRRRGGLTQISTDGVVRFMTDFHGFAAAGVSLTDFADDFSYLSQISQISQIFLSHRLLTCPGYSLRNSKLKTNVLWRL